MKSEKIGNVEQGMRKCVIPVYHDWTPEDVWKLIKPNLYESNGKIRMKKLDREPDGEPRGYTAILSVDDKHYYFESDDDECDCDISDGICRHWSEIR